MATKIGDCKWCGNPVYSSDDDYTEDESGVCHSDCADSAINDILGYNTRNDD